ncbi:MAG: hypothetical protein HETSPECPRED_003229 [Heterodermia speciosa]|uniref:Orn/DAP/Arg decarboxylase 2 N-terminal domain-containing protein n=1 Tax=Heterodermia speciosa TaxID=116794 RepID=A0A8H3PHL2_9LECA|nr:MAG: hypothetical protein HETSPECPRED_003229 [Heterodermia speciosa]
MDSILQLGVDPSRIIFANPCKTISSLRHAARRGILKTVFDNEAELLKIKDILPEARLYLRILADDTSSSIRFADKFGVSREEIPALIALAKRLCLDLVGVSFHVGTNSKNPQAFAQAIRDARFVYNTALQEGIVLQSVDIGGGFNNTNFEASAAALSSSMESEFGALLPKVTFMAEPGRFIAAEVFSLACKVIGLRSYPTNMAYINDGIYGNFMNAVIEPPIPTPVLLDFTEEATSHQKEGENATEYAIWGRTCDATDKINHSCEFHRRLYVNDWLLFKSMGGKTSDESSSKLEMQSY